jgi:hypothetical protein
MGAKLPRPIAAPGYTIQKRSHCGKLFVTVTTREGKPFEVFIRFGKAGGCCSAMADGIARLVSYGLRSGLDPGDAIKALSGISCHLGPKTCLNEVASAIRLVMKHLETAVDINRLIEDEEFADANAEETNSGASNEITRGEELPFGIVCAGAVEAVRTQIDV